MNFVESVSLLNNLQNFLKRVEINNQAFQRNIVNKLIQTVFLQNVASQTLVIVNKPTSPLI